MTNSLIEVRMLRVLNVLTDTNIGGAGTYVSTYFKNCDRKSFKPAILIPKGSKVLALLENVDCEIIEADIAPDKSLDLKSISVIRKIIKSGNYDVVHAHGSASARIAAKGICKCVFTKHTLSESSGFASKLIYGALGGYAVAVSDISANNLVELGFDKKRIYTVYNGVDDMSVPTAEQKNAAKKSFGIDPSKFVIGCVARFHPVKDHKTVLNAAKLLCEINDNVTFLFVGDGKLKDEMISYSNELGISDKCVFTGVVYDRPRVYHAMDMYTLASTHETFGLSLVESWSAGLPSVISDAGGLVEVSQGGNCTLVCSAGDAKQFSDAYCRLLQDSDMRKKMSICALLQYKNKFSAKKFAENLEKVYIDICR